MIINAFNFHQFHCVGYFEPGMMIHRMVANPAFEESVVKKHRWQITFHVSSCYEDEPDCTGMIEVEAEKCEVDGYTVIADGVKLHFWTDQIEVKPLSI